MRRVGWLGILRECHDERTSHALRKLSKSAEREGIVEGEVKETTYNKRSTARFASGRYSRSETAPHIS